MSESAVQTSDPKLITGLFADRESAERAYGCTSELGYSASDIDVLMAEETRRKLFPAHTTCTALAADVNSSVASQSNTASELGGPTGGTLGIAAPVAGAIGTLLLLPGVGLVVAGPVGIALTAAAAVGVAGGLTSALTHWGIPRSRVNEYEKDLREGGIVLAVKPRSQDDANRIVHCWTECCGASIRS